MFIPFFDVIINCSLDSMHCCWEGISKQMKKLWMDSVNHKQSWYIGDPTTLTRINQHLKKIQVPSQMRPAVPIQKGITWKGIVNQDIVRTYFFSH
jgi:hypothetical protein